MYALDAPDFFALAFRLPVYEGVLKLRMQQQQQEARSQPQEMPGTSASTPSAPAAGELTEQEVEALRNEIRVRSNPNALRPGEQPRYVAPDELMRLST